MSSTFLFFDVFSNTPALPIDRRRFPPCRHRWSETGLWLFPGPRASRDRSPECPCSRPLPSGRGTVPSTRRSLHSRAALPPGPQPGSARISDRRPGPRRRWRRRLRRCAGLRPATGQLERRLLRQPVCLRESAQNGLGAVKTVSIELKRCLHPIHGLFQTDPPPFSLSIGLANGFYKAILHLKGSC